MYMLYVGIYMLANGLVKLKDDQLHIFLYSALHLAEDDTYLNVASRTRTRKKMELFFLPFSNAPLSSILQSG